jgi:cytochrome c oxidase cbb3-type subunit I/II
LGFLLLGYNLARTVIGARPVVTSVEVVRLERAPEIAWAKLVFSTPVMVSAVVLALACAFFAANAYASPFFVLVAFTVAFAAVLATSAARQRGEPSWHRILEGRALVLTALATLAVLAGGVAEIVPALIVKPAEIATRDDVRPYRALEVEGRDVYVREGCYTCHSQMIRPMTFETARYGDPSKLSDSALDHPFQWGSKRTGPDLAREGSKYPNMWHYQHLIDPRAITAGSNMPPYAHLAAEKVDLAVTPAKMRALRSVGVPYKDAEIAEAAADARAQAGTIAKDLAEGGVEVDPESRMVATIAYLQRLGQKAPLPKPAKEIAHAP